MIKTFEKFNLLIGDIKHGERIYYKIYVNGSIERLNAALNLLHIKDNYYNFWASNGYNEKRIGEFMSNNKTYIYLFIDNRGSNADPSKIPIGNNKQLLISPYTDFSAEDLESKFFNIKMKNLMSDFKFGGEINMDESEVSIYNTLYKYNL